MRKKSFIVVALVIVLLIIMVACSKQAMVRNFGGSMTIDLPPNQKLEMITWKDEDSLWYLTKPMLNTDVAEVHTFQQDSKFGVFEGTVTIVETKD